MTLTHESVLQRFRERFAASAALGEQGKEAIPHGYSRGTFNFGPNAIYVTGGDGAYMDTVDGHRLVDLNNNFTVNVLGHDHPAITAALIEAIPGGISFGNPIAEEATLARMLIDRIASVERVQFSCSATESCMSAVRLARAATGRTRIAKFEGGYHGFSDLLYISAHSGPNDPAGPDDAPAALPGSGGIPAAALDDVLVLPQNDWAATEVLLRAHASDLACLIVELQTGSGGLVTLDRDFVARLRELTSELGIVLIFDETISLRAAFGGMQSIYDVAPDLTVMGKMIGGGLPLGAVGGRADLMALLGDGTVSISGTHHGHKLSVVAGIACLNAMQPAAYEHLNALAADITARVNAWAEQHGVPFSIFGGGSSHLAYAYWNDASWHDGMRAVRNHRDYWRSVNGPVTQLISLELANRGLFPVHRGEFSLSLPMTADDATLIVDTFTGILADLQ